MTLSLNLLLSIQDEVIESKRAKLTDDALSDVRVRDFWENKQKSFSSSGFLILLRRAIPTCLPINVMSGFELARSEEYEQRINKVDCGGFTPMVWRDRSRMIMALKQLANRAKTDQQHSIAYSLLRCRFMFSLLRSALVLWGDSIDRCVAPDS